MVDPLNPATRWARWLRGIKILTYGPPIALTLVAGWLARRHLWLALAVISVVSSYLFLMWRTQRLHVVLRRACLRNDVDTIEEVARRPSARLEGAVALAIHGGARRARAAFPDGHILCTCGECRLDEIDAQLCRFFELLMRAEHGEVDSAHRWVSLASEHPAAQLFVLLGWLSSAAHLDPGAAPALFEGVRLAERNPLVRWPVRLAMARERAMRGDAPGARAILAEIPAWPASSPLELRRRQLADELDAGGDELSTP